MAVEATGLKRFLAILGGATLRPEYPNPKRQVAVRTPLHDPRVGSRTFAAIASIWTLYVILALGISSDDGGWATVFISPVLIAVVWFAAYYVRDAIAARLAGSRLPGWALFVLVGLVTSLVTVGSTVGYGVRAAADPGLSRAASVLVYIGPWLGLLAAIWWALRRWRLRVDHVFWLLGLVGAAGAGGGIVLVALSAGNPFGALLFAAYVIPAYGVGPAVAYGLMPAAKLPTAPKDPTGGSFLMLGILMWVLLGLASYLWLGVLSAVIG